MELDLTDHFVNYLNIWSLSEFSKCISDFKRYFEIARKQRNSFRQRMLRSIRLQTHYIRYCLETYSTLTRGPGGVFMVDYKSTNNWKIAKSQYQWIITIKN
jgi:hypothetical protein